MAARRLVAGCGTSRTLVLGALAVLAAVGTACGDGNGGAASFPSTTEGPTPATDIEPGSANWMEIDFDTGSISAPGFNELIDDLRPTWAKTSRGAAEMLVGMEREGEIEVRPGGDRTVVVTVTRLPDDSVDAVRYALRFLSGEDGFFRFADGDWSQRCKPGRGHDDRFEPEPCV
jgi:hypothetical protein